MAKQCDRMDATFLLDLAECERVFLLDASNDIFAPRMRIALEKRNEFLRPAANGGLGFEEMKERRLDGGGNGKRSIGVRSVEDK